MSPRQALVAANWKMHGSLETIRPLVNGIVRGLNDATKAQVVLCPPFPYLQEVSDCLTGSSISLGAQDISAHSEGAYTGDVAGSMLRDYRCEMVIVGHSERRRDNVDTDERVAQKFASAVTSALTPVLCVGESLEERQAGDTEQVIARQLDAVLNANRIKAFENAVIAYEPVWAIGTGATAAPEQAQEAHAFIRLCLARNDNTIANKIRILYGGSVKADNAAELFKMADIDGGLIGGASLLIDDFLSICHSIQGK